MDKPQLTRRGFMAAAGIAGALPLAAAAQQGDTQAAGSAASVQIERDVVFGRGGDTDLHCDIYHPVATVPAKRMALIHYHGGAFVAGSKDTLGGKLTPFCALGYTCIAAQYRLAGVAKWPAPLEDVKTAIRWTRANADRLGILPGRIGLAGYSAGGFLVLQAGATPDQPALEGTGGNAGVSTAVAAVLAFYPATDVAPGRDGTAHALLPPGSDRAAHEALGVSHVVASLPPTMLFHGAADATIPLANSERLFAQMQQAKVPSELHVYAGVPHEFNTHADFADEVARTSDFFLDRHILNPRTYPPFRIPGRT